MDSSLYRADEVPVSRLTLARTINLLEKQLVLVQRFGSKPRLDNKHPDDYDDASAASTSGVGEMTPSQSELSSADDSGEGIATPRRLAESDHFPSAGKTFIISSQDGKVITLLNGKLLAADGYAFGGGWLWKCNNNRNWYEFRNTASGALLTREKKRFAASHEDGGYMFLSKFDDELLQMTIGEDGKSLVAVEDGGVSWNFIAVDHLAVSEE
ncbi:hypothetical protein PT974_08398 [Cladobotryum mycophilum]|uniref:Uncharacterized protein n=1 Tax=Cladobotryum mycophilum TaxID=491253 RepID=A0ABR0SD75_9HYPO